MRSLRGLSAVQRDSDGERSAATGSGIDLDTAVVSVDDGGRDIEPQSKTRSSTVLGIAALKMAHHRTEETAFS